MRTYHELMARSTGVDDLNAILEVALEGQLIGLPTVRVKSCRRRSHEVGFLPTVP